VWLIDAVADFFNIQVGLKLQQSLSELAAAGVVLG
jgi:hypothetical protein